MNIIKPLAVAARAIAMLGGGADGETGLRWRHPAQRREGRRGPLGERYKNWAFVVPYTADNDQQRGWLLKNVGNFPTYRHHKQSNGPRSGPDWPWPSAASSR